MKPKIDFHHHVLPPVYLSKLEELDMVKSLGVPFPKWSPKKSLSFMKKYKIETAILSVSTPGVYFSDLPLARDLARICNEYMAELKQNYPGRFGGFAVLPLPDVDGALEELHYALDDLNLDGVGLLTHYDGTYLGDEEFESLFSELNRRQCVVFVHPTDPPTTTDPDLGIPNALIEAPFETTRAVAHLIYAGSTQRYPDIHYILAHGGGAIPYLGWRIALIKYAQRNKKTPILKTYYDFLVKGGPAAGFEDLASMYFDTALTASPSALKALKEFAGTSKIVLGTDFPFAKLASIVLKDLQKFEEFTDEDFAMIYNANAGELLPDLVKKPILK